MGGGGGSSLFPAYEPYKDKNHRRQCKMSSSKKLTCNGTVRQVLICLRPSNQYLLPPLDTLYNCIKSPNFLNFKESRNKFQGINSASLCSLAGRYDNLIPTWFLAPTIPAQYYSHREVGMGEIELERRLEGQQFTNLGQKYQHD
jgi:hypothetical protein